MFLVDAVIGLMVLMGMGAGGLKLLRDSRKGFPWLKSVGKRVTALAEGRREPDRAALVGSICEQYAKNVHGLREAVAAIEANAKVDRKRAAEELALAERAESIIAEALEKDDREAAELAATAKINSERRAALLGQNAVTQENILVGLRQRLGEAELELDVIHTEADTVRMYASITEGNRKLYELISSLSSAGFTAAGQLKQLVDKTEREMEQSENLVSLARGSSTKSILALEARSRAQEEIGKIQAALALPAKAGQSANGESQHSEAVE